MQRIDQHSPEGKALQATIKRKLSDFLGAGYNDEVLPLYIVVMLAHGTTESVVVENLDAFLGEHSQAFTTWLFQHMGEASKVEALKIASNAGVAPSSAAAATSAAPVAGNAPAAAAAAAAPGNAAQKASPASLATLKAAQAAPSLTNQLSLSASMSAESSEDAAAGDEQASARQPEGPQQQAAAAPASPRRHSHEHAGSRREDHGSRHHRDERRHSDRDRRDDSRHRHEHSRRHETHRHDHRDHRRHDRISDYDRHPHYEHARPEEVYRPWGGGGWEPVWRPGYPQLPPFDRYGWAPAQLPPFVDPHDRGYARYGHERQRYRSLSPPHRSRSDRDHGPPDRYQEDAHGRWYEGMEDGRRLRRRDAREGSLVPPEVDFEAKAQDVPHAFRRQPMSQLAHVQQRYEPDNAAAHMRTGSAPDMVDAPTDGGSGGAQHTSAFDRLSDMPTEMPLSRSLPAGLTQQQQQQPQQQQPQQSVFARLDGIVSNGVGAQHRASQQQQQQQQQQGSVWDRLSGAQPQTAAEANGNVWRRLGPSAGQQPQQRQLQRPGSLDASSDMAAMRAELAKVASMLQQLRAGAQLERAAGINSLAVQAQGPADLRSVTVTSVHPLALEHTAILRAHFGVCGRIVRATVLRNQATGLPSGKVHIEYTDILAARKALRLARSLLLDRPVHVRAKALRRF